MEFEIKNLDFETFVKMFDNLINVLVDIDTDLKHISESFVVHNKRESDYLSLREDLETELETFK